MDLVSKLIQEDITSNPEAKVLYEKYDENLDFAITLVNLRGNLGWSQKDLAILLNKPQSIIARIENGEIKPSLDIMEEIDRVTKK
ncbi:helix-turn-helix domain-containing protein [Staphylococcus equorum]|uniref:helix-turn-helix domain-containing protein n=1 Tax=Staphylococcus equorum TaxID=246432 RepID=UPI00398B3EA8